MFCVLHGCSGVFYLRFAFWVLFFNTLFIALMCPFMFGCDTVFCVGFGRLLHFGLCSDGSLVLGYFVVFVDLFVGIDLLPRTLFIAYDGNNTLRPS